MARRATLLQERSDGFIKDISSGCRRKEGQDKQKQWKEDAIHRFAFYQASLAAPECENTSVRRLAVVAAAVAGSLNAAEPAFYPDVASILHRRCAGCHHPGQAAPFSLLSYDDAAKRAKLLAAVVRSSYMPPWPPSLEPGVLADDRRLTSEEKRTLLAWLDSDLEPGDPAHAPPAPQFASGWKLGHPDLVVRMSDSFTVPPDGPDVFRNFVLPVPVETLRYVRGFEFRPDNPRSVHHARLLLDRSGRSAAQDAADPGPGFPGGMALDAVFDPDGHWLGWTPGKQPALRPADIAWELRPGTDLVLELHLFPTGKPEQVQAAVGLYFSDAPPTRRPLTLRLGKNTIDIPAGDSDYRTEDSFMLPVDVEVLSVYAHAHYLATSVDAWADLPDGSTVPLLKIARWSFDWQDEYRYAEPLRLPAGAVLRMRFLYDNSAANPRNPHHPPRRVLHGWKTDEEMGDLWLQVVATDENDRAALHRAFAEQELRSQIAGLEVQLSAAPADIAKRITLAEHYLQQGRPAEAIPHLERVLAVDADNAPARHNLGVAYASLGDADASIRNYRLAVEADPLAVPSRSNLAVSLARSGRAQEAAALLRETIRLQPRYVEAYVNLGAVLVQQRRVEEAAEVYEQALRLDARHGIAHYNLADIRRVAGDLEQAERHYQAAAKSEHQQAADLARRALDLLSAQ